MEASRRRGCKSRTQKEIQLTPRRRRRSEPLSKHENEIPPDVPAIPAAQPEPEPDEARDKENTDWDSTPGNPFWNSVVAESLSQLESSQPRTAEADESALDKVFERVLLPRKVKRLKEQIKKMNLKRIPALKERDVKILAVIQAGSKGMQYCREVQNAGVKPHRAWIKDSCPGTYPGAYLEPKWRQRINDEKSKIRRKAELAHYPASKSSPRSKPA
jgi:hypothetical protein